MLQLLLPLLTLWSQQDKPLPDPAGFMAEFRKTLHSDDKLLRDYTYIEKETEITLDSKGQTRKAETNVYQVTHAAEDWQTSRRLISKNGVPLTEKELEKEDREEQQRIAKETRKRANQSEAKRQREKAKTDREESEVIDDIFLLYDYQLVRREARGNAATILVVFKPRAAYKPKTSGGKMFQHIAGRLWIAESDHELVRLEAEVIDPIKFGAGILAKLQKGSTLSFERKKINNEIWLPVKAEASLSGRLFLIKGINVREITEYSEHKKYSVDTILDFREPPPEKGHQ